MSSVPSGLATPDQINLRKETGGGLATPLSSSGVDTPDSVAHGAPPSQQQLYQVISQREAKVGGAAFGSWLEMYSERLALRAAAYAIKNVAAKWALLQWASLTAETARQLGAMSGALNRITAIGKSRGFEKWREVHEEALEPG